MNRFLRNSLIASTIVLSSHAFSLAQEKWTDSSGTKTIEAKFVKLDGIQLTIKKSDGKEIVIPLYKLDNESRLLARKLAKTPLSTASSSNSSSSSTTASSSGADPFPPNPTAQEYYDIATRELKKKNLIIRWDGLPESQRKDIERLVQLALTKVDQKTLDDIAKFKKSVLDALRGKKEFILKSKSLPIDGNIKPLVAQAYDPTLELIDAMISEDLLQLDKLKSSDLRSLALRYTSNTIPKIESLMKKLPIPDPFEAINQRMEGMKINQTSDDEATLSIVSAAGPIEQKCVKIEGKWIAKQEWDNWKTMKEQAEQAINAADAKKISLQVRQTLAAVSIPVGILAEAESQQDVDDVLRDLMKQAQGVSANFGPAAFGGMAPPR